MGQVITNFDQIARLVDATFVSAYGIVRNDSNSAWKFAPVARLDAAQSFSATQTFAAGMSCPGSGTNSQEIGPSATTGGQNTSLAVGYNASVTTGSFGNGTALGASATAKAHNSTAIGASSVASNEDCLAMGYTATASSIQAVALGGASQATGVRAVAVGYNARATANRAICLGANTTSGAYTHVIALGEYAAPDANGQLFIANRDANRSEIVNATNSSTSTLRKLGNLTYTWATNTDASRKARLVFNIADTSDREYARAESDGSRGYLMLACHTTAPADAMLPNNSIAFYSNSGTPTWKYKDNSGTVTTGAL